ncbi:MAG TPA: hypothetical protein H9996_02390 [Candidatus Faecalibacterium avium]|nr:hypothetical protein [Candidatus Faecalibacterium avium]
MIEKQANLEHKMQIHAAVPKPDPAGPETAGTGQKAQKWLKRAFSLPFFSYNVHYTKYIHRQKSLSSLVHPPGILRHGLRCGQYKTHPLTCASHRCKDALFVILSFFQRLAAHQRKSQMAP